MDPATGVWYLPNNDVPLSQRSMLYILLGIVLLVVTIFWCGMYAKAEGYLDRARSSAMHENQNNWDLEADRDITEEGTTDTEISSVRLLDSGVRYVKPGVEGEIDDPPPAYDSLFV